MHHAARSAARGAPRRLPGPHAGRARNQSRRCSPPWRHRCAGTRPWCGRGLSRLRRVVRRGRGHQRLYRRPRPAVRAVVRPRQCADHQHAGERGHGLDRAGPGRRHCAERRRSTAARSSRPRTTRICPWCWSLTRACPMDRACRWSTKQFRWRSSADRCPAPSATAARHRPPEAAISGRGRCSWRRRSRCPRPCPRRSRCRLRSPRTISARASPACRCRCRGYRLAASAAEPRAAAAVALARAVAAAALVAGMQVLAARAPASPSAAVG